LFRVAAECHESPLSAFQIVASPLSTKWGSAPSEAA
jgi:hypothetical protein